MTHSIVKNHAFHNGNKRTGLAALLTALHRNGSSLKPSVTDDHVFDLIVAVTADEFPKAKHGLPVDKVIHELAWWIKRNIESTRRNLGAFRLSDFIDRCVAAGISHKFANGAHYLMNRKIVKKGKPLSLRIAGSTRQLDGPAAASYVRKLGLNAQNSGIDSNEFYDGARVEREIIHRYIAALRRLAKT